VIYGDDDAQAETGRGDGGPVGDGLGDSLAPHDERGKQRGRGVGHGARRRRRRQLARNAVRSVLMVVLVVILGVSVHTLIGHTQPAYDPALQVAFIGTNEDSQCVVLWQKDFAVMIDVAEKKDQAAIRGFIDSHGIKRLDYLVLPRPDKDHLQLAADLTKTVQTAAVVQPMYRAANRLDASIHARLSANKTSTIILVRPLEAKVHDLSVTVYPPDKESYDNADDYSLAVSVVHRNVRMLFPGNAGDARLSELMERSWGTLDLYVLPQHGTYGETSRKLYSQLRPAKTVATSANVGARMRVAGNGWGTTWYSPLGATVEFRSDGDTLFTK